MDIRTYLGHVKVIFMDKKVIIYIKDLNRKGSVVGVLRLVVMSSKV